MNRKKLLENVNCTGVTGCWFAVNECEYGFLFGWHHAISWIENWKRNKKKTRELASLHVMHKNEYKGHIQYIVDLLTLRIFVWFSTLRMTIACCTSNSIINKLLMGSHEKKKNPRSLRFETIIKRQLMNNERQTACYVQRCRNCKIGDDDDPWNRSTSRLYRRQLRIRFKGNSYT